MTQTSNNPEREVIDQPDPDETLAEVGDEWEVREWMVATLRLFWDQRRFLCRVVAGGLVAATLLAFLTPNRYQSTSRLMPPDNQSTSGMAMLAGLSARAGGLGAIAGDLMGLKSSSKLFIGILNSRTVQDRLIHQFDLKKVYGVRRMEDAREELEDHSRISEDRKSGIIVITVTDKDPQRAASMAQAYTEVLNRLVAELTTSTAHRERVFLEEHLKTVKQGLDAAAKEFSEFASKNTAINIEAQGRAMVEAAAIQQGQLIASQAELEALLQIYTNNNVRVRAARARIAELQSQLEKLGGKETVSADGHGSSYGSPYPSIRQLPLLGVTYADLYRRTKIQETVYELLTQQYELAKVQEVKEIPSVKVLDAANVPEKKSYPPRLLFMFLGTFLSLAFGVVWVLGSARWEQIDPQDPEKVLAREVFTTLQAQKSWALQNSNRLRGVARKIWGRLNPSQRQSEEHK